MSRTRSKTVLLCPLLLALASPLTRAQNATSGGDQQSQPDAQTGNANRGPDGSPRAAGGRRGGGVRGSVTSVNGSNISLKTETGETWSVISTENTRVRRDGQPGTMAGVQAGDEVVAMGLPDGEKHEVHALMVMDLSAAEVAKAKANLGKTYILGRITAINDTQLTVLRTDRVSQTIALDETTSLRRGGRMNPQEMAAAGLDGIWMGGGAQGGGGRRRNENGRAAGAPDADGESITLADVKVGDNIAATGSLKGGSFVPLDLHVSERPAGRRGGNGQGPNGDSPQNALPR